MIGELEVVGHAAHPVPTRSGDALAERRGQKVAPEVVHPLVVRAHELVRVTARRATERDTAMRAAIQERAHRAIGLAHDDDGLLPDPRRDEVARSRDLALERDVAPERPTEDALLLARVQLRV